VALVTHYPFVLVINPSLPARTVPELIQLAQRQPGQLFYASPGVASSQHLYMELFKNMTGIDVGHVPYNGTAPAVIDIVAEPRAPRLHPETTAAAQYSLPFAVASSIVGGRDGLELFDEDARHDRRVLTLAERVHHRADPTAPFPHSYGGTMRVHTRSGRTMQFEEPINRGHPDRPLTEDELNDKFLSNAVPRLGEARARAAMRALTQVAAAPAIEDVTATLRTP
jgi:2-methylcitrate dehydratase PrpD